jgi:nicotinate-nucleotide adenylyltransferase
MVGTDVARRRPAAGHPQACRPGLKLEPGMAVGLYGGSFNPVHKGHVHVAETARKRLGLDRVLWLVAPQNPLKSAAMTADLAVRLADVRRRARGPHMIVSDLERRIGTRYTIDTVRWLKARFPGVRFVWIMGADSLASFHRWRGWADLAREVPIAVISRPGVALRSQLSPLARRFASHRRPAREGKLLARRAVPAWLYLPAPFHAISSTEVRDSRLTNSAPRDMRTIV